MFEETKINWKQAALASGVGILSLLLAAGLLTLLEPALRLFKLCGPITCNFEQDGVATIWAALITLLGGVLALAGALYVASKQGKILKNQIDAQNSAASRAHDLEERRFQAEQFERKLSVFQNTRAWLEPVFARYVHEVVPEDDEVWAIKENDLRRAFFESLTMAEFFFPPDVPKRLRFLYQKTWALMRRKDRLDQLRAQSVRTQREELRMVELERIVDDLIEEVDQMDASLIDLFKPHMAFARID